MILRLEGWGIHYLYFTIIMVIEASRIKLLILTIQSIMRLRLTLLLGVVFYTIVLNQQSNLPVHIYIGTCTRRHLDPADHSYTGIAVNPHHRYSRDWDIHRDTRDWDKSQVQGLVQLP